jgi:high-affinity nickel-transport protein
MIDMTTQLSPVEIGRRQSRFTRDEVPRLLAMAGFIAALHVIGWGLFTHYDSIPSIHGLTGADGTLVYAGAGVLAYTLGLRHAFDADHIAAIDDTTRFLLQKGKRRFRTRSPGSAASSARWCREPSCTSSPR